MEPMHCFRGSMLPASPLSELQDSLKSSHNKEVSRLINDCSRPSLLESVIEAHGGLDRWQKVKSVDVTWNFSGWLLALKGYPRHYQPSATIDVKNTKIVIQGLGESDSGDRWIYTRHRVWIERRDGAILASRDDPRSQPWPDRQSKWDDLQLLYFIGYALHNYLTCPFKFAEPGFETHEVEPHQENGDTWRVLHVTFPFDEYPAHGKFQRFYFDDAFMLKCIDYDPDVSHGRAAHYTYDVETFDGIKVPTFRRVVVRKLAENAMTQSFPIKGEPNVNGPSAFRLDYTHVKFCENGSM